MNSPSTSNVMCFTKVRLHNTRNTLEDFSVKAHKNKEKKKKHKTVTGARQKGKERHPSMEGETKW